MRRYALYRLCLLLLSVALFISLGAENVFADTSVVTATIIGGLLTETVVPTVAFTASPGSTGTYNLPITVSDLTGSASGWHLTITSTPFTGTGGTFPTTASTITSLTAACLVPGTCSSNTLTNDVGTLPAVPAATIPPTAVKFFGTAAGTGTGIFTVTPTISVVVPATTALGVYVSNVTIAVINTP